MSKINVRVRKRRAPAVPQGQSPVVSLRGKKAEDSVVVGEPPIPCFVPPPPPTEPPPPQGCASPVGPLSPEHGGHPFADSVEEAEGNCFSELFNCCIVFTFLLRM